LMLDTERIYHITWRTAGRELGYQFTDALLHATTGRTFPDCYRLLIDTHGPAFPLETFQGLWPVHWNRYVARNGIPQKPGLAPLLDLLEGKGVPKAVATSTTRDEAHFTLRTGQIDKYFSIVVSGDQITQGKPAPDIYLEAARRLGVDPHSCIALEDSEAGVQAGAAAGMYTIMIPDTKPPSAEVAARARHVFPTLNEVRQLIETEWLQ
jgi:HAD superfamily hydrolase (TIGR01509 family)